MSSAVHFVRLALTGSYRICATAHRMDKEPYTLISDNYEQRIDDVLNAIPRFLNEDPEVDKVCLYMDGTYFATVTRLEGIIFE